MPTLKLPNRFARDLADIEAPNTTIAYYWEDYQPSNTVTEVVENRDIHDNHRWESVHELIIRTKDTALWRALYRQGLTERQDTTPFEYDGDEIEFTQVKPVPVSHIEYQPVD